MRLIPTGEMTLGPFFPREFAQAASDLSVGATGEVIEITGRITQVDGRALDNVVLELWQADSRGRFDNPDFFGWGRAATDANGVYRFRTVKPGAYEGRAPHVNLLILYSGLMRQLQTVMFFEGDNGKDAVFNAVMPAPLRERLVAKTVGRNALRFDIRLRGEGETPFFDD
jgi:protocatechuate 3,4-dioxygenase alpha subunit